MRKTADPFYHSAAWRKVRAAALMRDHYLCQECLRAYERGDARRIRTATTVHHVIPREERPDLSLEMSNLESICAICHNQQHPEKGARPGSATKIPDGVRIIKI